MLETCKFSPFLRPCKLNCIFHCILRRHGPVRTDSTCTREAPAYITLTLSFSVGMRPQQSGLSGLKVYQMHFGINKQQLLKSLVQPGRK